MYQRITMMVLLFAMTWAPLFSAEVKLGKQTFTLPDGFTIESIAAPPLIQRPVSAIFDEQGRLYVTDSSGTNEPSKVQLEKKPHRIIRLEDTNNDGKFDTSKVYAEGLMFPEGTMWLDGSLYVAAPPEIWKFTDADDDGVAEKREVWFDGKTLTGCANDLHGPYLGPDGWIYWCKGAFAEQTHEQTGGDPLVTRASHIFRRRPSGGPLESVMVGGMDNPVDVVFTPGGERIFTTTFLVHPGNGQRDGTIHAIYGGVYGKVHSVLDGHPRTGDIMPVLSHLGAAAPCGNHRIYSDYLGKDYQNNLMVCSFSMRTIFRHQLTQSGGSFTAEVTPFLSSDHVDFHSTDVLEDADGSLIVVDTGGWYKLCCPTSQLEKPDILGAIYRIRRTGAKTLPDPRGLHIDWNSQTDKQLAGLLGDARWAVAERAKQLLAKRGATAVDAIADTLAGNPSQPHRLNAVWALTWHNTEAARIAVRKALSDTDGDVRQAALHSISLHRDRNAHEAVLSQLHSASLHNRRAAAEALGRMGTSKDIPLLLELAGQNPPRAVEHSMIYAVLELNSTEPIKQLLASNDLNTLRPALVALDQSKNSPITPSDVIPHLSSPNPSLQTTAWWITEQHPTWADKLVPAFEYQLVHHSQTENEIATLQSRLEHFIQSPAIQDFMGRLLADNRTSTGNRKMLLTVMAGSRLSALPVSWQSPIQGQLESADEVLVTSAVSAIKAYAGKPINQEAADRFTSKLVQLASSTTASPFVRLEAFAALPANQRPLDTLALQFLCDHLSTDKPVQLRASAVDVIATLNMTVTQHMAVITASRETGPMELKRIMEFSTMRKSEPFGLFLLESLLHTPAALTLNIDTLEKQFAGYSETVQTASQSLINKIQLDAKLRIAKIDTVLGLMESADVRRGHQIFNSTRTSCLACHQMAYAGGRIGPDLSRIGQIRTNQDLLEAILFPSLSFVRSYEPTSLITTDGKVLNGMITDENSQEVTLVIDHQRKVILPVAEIDERLSGTVSVMPAGLDKELTVQELADLVKFLKSR
ncbi:MAG: PVC-type heme-binding CxxCH protein [Planctomycetota bacterium]|nr:PVC-type heme-binding CxxCH protein [Planctomycetota bacterium]